MPCLLPEPLLELTVCEPAKSVSLVENTYGRVSSSGYRATFVFHFVSHWLKSKLKVKRMISCRNSYEECVLPGISPAILSFLCVKGVKCCFGSREDTWPLMTRLQTVQRLFSEQSWFTLFSRVQHTDMTSRSSTVVNKRPFFLTYCGIRAHNQDSLR